MNGKDDTCHTCGENIDQFVCSSYILQVHPHSQTDVRDLGSGWGWGERSDWEESVLPVVWLSAVLSTAADLQAGHNNTPHRVSHLDTEILTQVNQNND